MITKAYAGQMPWAAKGDHPSRNAAKAGWQWNLGVGVKKTSRKKNADTVQYVTGGWSMFNKDEYDQNVKKNGLFQFRLYNGRKSWVPGGDVDAHIGFRTLTAEQVNQDVAKFIESAWSGEVPPGRKVPDLIKEFEGNGHIQHVKYNVNKRVMEVLFGGTNSDGRTARADTVTFLDVPSDVYETLAHCKGSKGLGVDGKQRNLLGIKFWDLVRIRGSRFRARYLSTGGSAAVETGYDPQLPIGAFAPTMPFQPVSTEPQRVNAQEEATLTHESDANVKDDTATVDVIAKMNSNGKYTPAQKDMIQAIREKLEERHHGNLDHPDFKEFYDAIQKGMGDIFVFKTKHGIYTNR